MRRDVLQQIVAHAQFIEQECPYYPERLSRDQLFPADFMVDSLLQDVLLNSGFRRYSRFYYRPQCHGCSKCQGYRVPVDLFKPHRSFRRIEKKNSDLTVIWKPPRETEEKRELYLAYQKNQHAREEDPENLLSNMHEQMYVHPWNAAELELRLGGEEGKLLAFAVFDRSYTTLSAVYSVYDTGEKERSLGTYMILEAFRYARTHGFVYLNLGYFIEGHEKMNYKSRFVPAELYSFAEEKWLPAEESES